MRKRDCMCLLIMNNLHTKDIGHFPFILDRNMCSNLSLKMHYFILGIAEESKIIYMRRHN